jgi:hypothetical protein
MSNRRMVQAGRSVAIAASTVVLALLVAGPVWASSPGSGRVGPSAPSSGWSGQHYVAGATASPAACGAGGDTLCDHHSVSVGVASSYWDTHTGGLRVSIRWPDSADNFDLYVYSGGNLVGSSTSGSSHSESVSVANAAGSYSVVVVPKLVTDSGYSGSASFSSQAKPAPKPSPSGGGGGGSHQGGSGGSGGTGGTGGSGGGGSIPTGAGGGGSPVVQPGSPLPFGPLKGPIFDYNGPYYFKPPFSVGGSPGHAIQPPQLPGFGSGGTGGGHAVQPAQPGQPASGSQPDSRQPVRIQTVGGTPDRSGPSLIWLLVPLALVLVAAVGSALFESDQERVPATSARSGRPAPRRDGPPPGAFVTLGFATRRAVGAVGRGIRRLSKRS